MKKVILNSIIKDYKSSLPTILIISFMICVVFSSLTAQYSQSYYVKKVIEDNTTRAQAEFFDIDYSQLEYVKSDNSIKSISVTKSFGKAFIENETSENLLEFNRDYFDNFNLNLVEGRFPTNKDEIILEKSILDKYNLKINDDLKLKGNKIVDSAKGEKECINYNVKSKIVGYYTYPRIVENLCKYQDIFISSKNGLNDVINNKYITYNGTISFKPGVNTINKSAELSYNINSSSDHIVPNSMFDELNQQITASSTLTNIDRITILIAAIIILNISILNSIESSKRQGLLRLLGCSKKKTIIIELLKSLIIYIVSCSLALMVSVFISRMLINSFDFTGSLIDSKKANVLFSVNLFVKVVEPLFIVYMATSLYSCKEILYKTPIQQYSKGQDYSSKLVKILRLRKLEHKILINNLLSEKLFIVSNIVILAFSGYMYLVNYYNTVPASVTNNELAFYEKVDFNVYREFNVNKNLVYFGKNDLNSIRNIEGIKGVYGVSSEDGYEYLNTNQLTTDYKQLHMINDNEIKGLRFDILSFDNNGINKFLVDNDFIENNASIGSESDIPNVLVYNQFYSIIQHENKNVIENLKKGDIIKISLPHYDINGDIQYKNHKVRVAGFLSKEWYIYSNTEQAIPDIVLLDRDFEKLVGRRGADSIYITLNKKNSINNVKNEIEKIYGDNLYVNIKTKADAFNDANKLVDSFKMRKVTISYFLLLMSSVNIIIGLVVSFVRNYNLYSIVNALGGNKRKLKRISLYEILVLIVPGLLIGILYCTIDAYKFYDFWKERALLKGLSIDIYFTVPYINILVYILLVFASGTIAYVLINRIIKAIKIN
ncbi:efflux ABC transporter, permease protein [Peptostreptococcus stomatis DSM 17678]|uniref:Efflux ABC transporter, permease protein n=1 Tax=Peptostreptococcus stomatis DSM 17678 TaxID=596315 RepID=E0E1I7_9FIRM|nr:ABC transporter permease [Peptostreptococcus stomatis]EFM65241.1 efflux ABC transporter, permease protein [Peptostreptococcus stomatis DSM 17678]